MKLPIKELKVAILESKRRGYELLVAHETLVSLGLTYDDSYTGQSGDEYIYFTNVRKEEK